MDQVETFDFEGQEVKLNLRNDVFQPTTTTKLLLKHMGEVKGKRVLDLGCGAGPVAITAAKKGASEVYAVDVMEEAPKLAAENIKLNGLEDTVTAMQSNLYEKLKGEKFDVIVDDVSGMAEEVARMSSWYPDSIPSGGYDGTQPSIDMLEGAPEHLNKDGYLIFPVITLAKADKIIDKAKEIFGDKLEHLDSKLIPLQDELKVYAERLRELKEEGIIDFIEKRSRMLWTLHIYKATLS